MKFNIDDDILTIQLQGAEQVWAIKRQVVVRRANIVLAQWHEVLAVPRGELGWRFGTAIPGGLWAGRFTARGAHNFLYVQRTSGIFGTIGMNHVLVLDLRDSEFQRLYLTVDDPDMAGKIIAWWSGSN